MVYLIVILFFKNILYYAELRLIKIKLLHIHRMYEHVTILILFAVGFMCHELCPSSHTNTGHEGHMPKVSILYSKHGM